MISSYFKRLISVVMIGAFLATNMPVSYAQVFLPEPGSMVNVSAVSSPAVLRGIKINAHDPFKLDFLVDAGRGELADQGFKDESTKLIKYFLTSLTIKEDDMWVNLSPYEKDRIIPNSFGITEMGRDLLSEDYLLKQVASSLMYPENEPGKAFWQEIYKKVYERYGTTDIPVDTFNKVWITPDKAVVFEDRGVAFIGESHLKVMLESDYLAEQGATGNRQQTAENPEVSCPAAGCQLPVASDDLQPFSSTQDLAKDIIREIMVPIIEKEVNEGENFQVLRQMYQSLILAAWYKKRLKESILSQVYADKGKTSGIDVADKEISEKIYQQYIESFKKGAYNYIKEEYDLNSNDLIPRKYFSGGVNFKMLSETDDAMTMITKADRSQVALYLRKALSAALFVVGVSLSPVAVASQAEPAVQTTSASEVQNELPAIQLQLSPAAEKLTQEFDEIDAERQVEQELEQFPFVMSNGLWSGSWNDQRGGVENLYTLYKMSGYLSGQMMEKQDIDKVFAVAPYFLLAKYISILNHEFNGHYAAYRANGYSADDLEMYIGLGSGYVINNSDRLLSHEDRIGVIVAGIGANSILANTIAADTSYRRSDVLGYALYLLSKINLSEYIGLRSWESLGNDVGNYRKEMNLAYGGTSEDPVISEKKLEVAAWLNVVDPLLFGAGFFWEKGNRYLPRMSVELTRFGVEYSLRTGDEYVRYGKDPNGVIFYGIGGKTKKIFGDWKMEIGVDFWKQPQGIGGSGTLRGEQMFSDDFSLILEFGYKTPGVLGGRPFREDTQITMGISYHPSDKAQGEALDNNVGGIDLNASKIDLDVQGDSSVAMKLLDPSKLAQFMKAPGLVPFIMSIQPVTNLLGFLGLEEDALEESLVWNVPGVLSGHIEMASIKPKRLAVISA